MPSSEHVTSDIVVSLSRGRFAVMARASELLSKTPTETDGGSHSDVQMVSGLLMTALEELKVAEEELRIQNATLEAQRVGVDERTRHYHRLFLDAPMAALLTDSYGTIVEVNAEAAAMLRRDARHLQRKPFTALVPVEEREAFRQQFGRLTPEDGARNWRFSVTRTGHVPLAVIASVKLVAELGPTRGGMFYWLLREAETS